MESSRKMRIEEKLKENQIDITGKVKMEKFGGRRKNK